MSNRKSPVLTLVSHNLCPYVQRAAIALTEKQAPFTRRWIDLSDKPDWFLSVSPTGKVPVLLVDGSPIFESAAILDYLDEVLSPQLHPNDPVQRARHRGWIAFASGVLDAIAGLYNAKDEGAFVAKRAEIAGRFREIEAALGAAPWFAGAQFSMVDAAFGPVFRYFDVFDDIGVGGIPDDLPKVAAWRAALAERPSVRNAIDDGYSERLRLFLIGRESWISQFALHSVED